MGLTFPRVDSDGACFQPRIVDVRWLDHQESHIIESQTSRAVELSTSGIIHVADPYDEIEPQRSMNVVHLKALEFGIVKPVRK
jgi:hypothetical protein